jgi:tetratricopeptide (TPR) repeat protein
MFRKLRDDEGLGRALIALGSGLGNEGRLDEADAALDEAVDIALRHNDKVVVARALNQVAYIAARRGDFARAAEVHRNELARWIELGSLRGEATDLRLLAVDLLTLGEIDEAEQLAERALAIWTELDDPTSIAHVRATLGDIARTRGDLERASELYSAAMEGFDAVGDRRCTASTFKNFGVIAARRGEHGRSDELFRRGLELRYELGDEAGLAECLEGLAGAYLATGRPADAALLLGAADSLREATGSSVSSDEKPRLAGLTEASRAALGIEAFDKAWEAGTQCCSADVMEFIERDVDSRTPVR